MMNAYSKIGSTTTTTTTHKSRSIDFSEFPAPPQTPRSNNTQLDQPPSNHIQQQPNINHNSSPTQTQGQRFGVILGRSCSVSASSPSPSGFQATIKRAFSVTRSSSVTDRYCRIHDQSMSIPSDDEDINIDDAPNNKTNRRGRRGKILKACKRLFGL
ncbi:hypothetical protein L195_g020881 [Trifolium pratense]|uniref:Uncharacterized protein n=1 Tax=Trifolium pratense TaxID=57577 RepID=A0A2K3N3N2_TRIPR|nr:hypothetical protein L195_g020881 [Trifolium pratense]